MSTSGRTAHLAEPNLHRAGPEWVGGTGEGDGGGGGGHIKGGAKH